MFDKSAERGKTTDFFISYNKADEAWAVWIAWVVEEAGYKVIIEAWDFRPGGNFVQKMNEAVAEAERTIAVLSPNYLSPQARYAFAEWAAAIAQDPTGEKGKLVPVRIADCDVRGLLSTIIYIDLVGLVDESAAREKLRAGLQKGCPKLKTPVFPAAKPLFPPNSVRRPPRLPPKPLCLGRNTQVNDLVTTLLGDHPEPTPILGEPGMGKSTVLLSALYDARVEDRYKDRCYFVQCKVASSRQTLVEAIAKEIKVSPSGSESEPRVLEELEKAPAVLALDGAETPWLADKGNVEDFLARLSQISDLALVASFQGLARPGGVQWRDTIFVDKPLELADARQVFLKAAGIMEFSQDPSLNQLLEAVDRVPLAIVQIAKVAHSYHSDKEGLKAVLDQWRIHKLVLPDLDASLSASIESLRRRADREGMTDKDKEASERLLKLLGVLPNGIAQEELDAILPDCKYAPDFILRDAALVFKNENRLLVRAPVREYVAHFHPPGPDDLKRLIKHFATTYGSKLGTLNGAVAVKKLGDEIANLEAILLKGLELPDPTPSIDAGVDVAAVILYSGLGTTKVLEKARYMAGRCEDKLRQAHCIRRMGDVVRRRCEYKKACDYYQEACDIYGSESRVYIAHCKQSMGDTELLVTNYSAASAYFREAKKLYKGAKDKAGEANSTKSLGDIERELGHYDAAEQLYEEAFFLYRESSDVLGQANCIKGKGDNKLAQHDPEAARNFFEQARPMYDAVGDILGKANCTKGLADIERELGHYDAAERHYNKAFEDFAQLNNDLYQANCIKGKGDLAMNRGNFDEARRHYDNALELYSRVKNDLGKANCTKYLADLELKSRQFNKAASLYTLVSRKKCTNPCSCETIVCTIPVASAAWCDRQA